MAGVLPNPLWICHCAKHASQERLTYSPTRFSGIPVSWLLMQGLEHCNGLETPRAARHIGLVLLFLLF